MNKSGAVNPEPYATGNVEATKSHPPLVFVAAIVFFVIVILVGILIAVNFISFEDGKLTLGSSKGLNLKSAYIDGENINVVVERGSAKGNLTGIRFIFYYNDTENITLERNVNLEEGEERTFVFNSTELLGVSNYQGVSIAPIYSSVSGETTVGEIEDTEEISATPPVGTASDGGSGGGGGGTETTPEENTTSNLTGNGTPTVGSLTLSSSSGNDFETDNLTASSQNAYDYSTLIYDWRIDGNSMAVLNMPFDTNTSRIGATVRDYSSYGNNGDPGDSKIGKNASWISNGVSGGAYNFDGNDIITIGDSSSLDFTDEITILAWVKLEAPSPDATIVSKSYYTVAEGVTGSWFFGLDNTGNKTKCDPTTVGGSVVSTREINPNEWTFVACTFNGTKVTVYTDDSYVTGTRSNPIPLSDYPIGIGSSTNGTNYETGITAMIDGVQIYNRELSREQIIAMYNNGVPKYDLIVSNETTYGESWSVRVTPNNRTQDGATVSSNTLAITSLTPYPSGPTGSWNLIMSDEFDSDSLNTSLWNRQFYWWPTVINNELQYYDPTAEAYVEVSNGLLHIIADEVPQSGQNYSSGSISGHDKFFFTYGVAEMRAKLPSGKGLWPAFWMLNQSRGQPEIDIMENIGSDPTTVAFNFHWIDENGTLHGLPWTAYAGPDFSSDYHTFTVNWQPDRIEWYVDGVQRATINDSTAPIPDTDMYILANLAVGGNWPGPPDSNTVFPAVYDIDYIRVWQ